jgi:transcriptional regulator with XRE-family HTH domain
MTETTTLGADLRRERERRGLALRTISESTKVSVALLEGLEADDISRWPGGIFRRAFVRAYAQCVGLDADEVFRRFERQFPVEGAEPIDPAEALVAASARPTVVRQLPARQAPPVAAIASRTRLLGTAADLTVAAVLAFGAAAAGSRLLWPVLLIACYYAAGVLFTGTSPMVALLSDSLAPAKPKPLPVPVPVPAPAPQPIEASEPVPPRPAPRAPRIAAERPVRQRRGMQAPV